MPDKAFFSARHHGGIDVVASFVIFGAESDL
jgi:hypothetical protein